MLRDEIELTSFAFMVTSSITESTSLAGGDCGSSSLCNNLQEVNGQGKKGEKDVFVFPLSFLEVIRCCSTLQGGGK